MIQWWHVTCRLKSTCENPLIRFSHLQWSVMGSRDRDCFQIRICWFCQCHTNNPAIRPHILWCGRKVDELMSAVQYVLQLSEIFVCCLWLGGGPESSLAKKRKINPTHRRIHCRCLVLSSHLISSLLTRPCPPYPKSCSSDLPYQ